LDPWQETFQNDELSVAPEKTRQVAFGRYLMQQGHVTSDELLQALIEQRRQREPLAAILSDYVAAESLIAALDEVHGEDLQVLAILQARDFLSEHQAVLVERQWRQSAPPLGATLAKHGSLKRSDVVRYLAEYHKSLKKSVTAVAVDPGLAAVPVTRFIHRQPSGSPLPDAEIIANESVILQEFYDVFSQETRVAMEQQLLKLESNEEHYQQLCQEIYRSYHSLKGTAGFVNAVRLSFFVHVLEESLSLAKREQSRVAAGELSRLVDLHVSGLDLIWQHVETVTCGEYEPIDGNDEQAAIIESIQLWSQELQDRLAHDPKSIQELDDLF
jgi:HPt (histidine-containing phosphotransfer) domain-containing protein